LVPKYMKRKIKCGWTGCCSLKRPGLSSILGLFAWGSLAARSSELLTEATFLFAHSSLKRTVSRSDLGTLAWASLRARLSEHSGVQIKNNFEFQNPFSQTLKFWSFHTQNTSQIMFIGHIHKHTLKNAQN